MERLVGAPLTPLANAVLCFFVAPALLRAKKSRSRVEELEDIAELVSGGDGLEGHLEAAADLHRAVVLLWEGVSGVLQALPEARRRPGGTDGNNEEVTASREVLVAPPASVAALALSKDRSGEEDCSDAAAAGDDDAIDEIARDVSRMLRDQEHLDIPMHLEDLPVSVVTAALSVDSGRVQAATKFLVPGMLSALSAAAAAAAVAAAATSRQRDGDNSVGAAPPLEAGSPAPAAPALPTPAVLPPPRTPTPDDLEEPPRSGRQRLSTSADSGLLSSEGSEEERERVASTASSGGLALSEEETREAAEDDVIQGEGMVLMSLFTMMSCTCCIRLLPRPSALSLRVLNQRHPDYSRFFRRHDTRSRSIFDLDVEIDDP